MSRTLLKDDVAEIVHQAPAATMPPYAEVRARIARRHRGSRPNPCREIILPEDLPTRKVKKKTRRHYAIDWRNTAQRDLGAAWARVQQAYLDGHLRDGQVYGVGEIRRVCGVAENVIECLQMDLAEHRALLRLVAVGPARLRVRAW